MRESWTKKIALGTAQFGLDYGISNKSGQVAPAAVAEILRLAARRGVETLDTAIAYGDSEETLGAAFSSAGGEFEIVSKFPPNTENVGEALRGSLERLKLEKLKAFLAHDFDSFKNTETRKQLAEAKRRGLTAQIGVSVYYPSQIEFLLDEAIEFDIVQLPFSVFDQRFRRVFKRLKENKIEIHARSVFLQGLFFLPPEDLPEQFSSVKSRLINLRELCAAQNIPLSALLLNYAMAQPEIDKTVVGVTNAAELEQNLDAQNYYEQCELLCAELAEYAVADDKIILPFNWNK